MTAMAAVCVFGGGRSIFSACRCSTPLAVGGGVQARHAHSGDLATYKRGRGGQHSFSGTVATVFGSSGFLGRYVINRIAKSGTQVIVPYRGDPYDVMRMKVASDLGQMLFYPYEVTDEESIRKAVKYSNVVINLVGRDFETKNFTFEDVNVRAARAIARASRQMGVKTLVHVSALNASDTPPSVFLNGGSKFLRTKARGEIAVREEFPDAIIMRPADMYGPEDRFLRYLIGSWRRSGKLVPMWKKGEQTVKQPIFVGDVGKGICNAIYDPSAVGKTFQCVGPHRYKLSDLSDWVYNVTHRSHEEWGYRRVNIRPWSLYFKTKVSLVEKLPGRPKLGWDKLERECVTDVVTSALPTVEDLGVTLTKFEDRAPFEMHQFDRLAYYEQELGEFPVVPTPPIQPAPV